MKQNPKIIAFLQAVGLTAYVSLLAFFMSNLQKWFGDQPDDKILAPVVFLLIFIISALISASIMLGYPITLFLEGKKKEAIKIVLQSVGWLIIFLLTIVFFLLPK